MDAEYRITWQLPDGSRRASDGYRPLNILAHADMVELDLPQACGGKAECGTCRVIVHAGETTPVSGEEARLMRRFPKRFEAGERLACQCRPRGDLTVELLRLRPPDLRELEAEAEGEVHPL